MLLKSLQLLIFFGFLAANIRFELTPNSYVAAVVAFLLAMIPGAIPFMISDSKKALAKAAGALRAALR